MNTQKIEKFEDLLSNELRNAEKIVDYETTYLTKPGENYSSELLRARVIIKNVETNEERVLDTVVKLLPTNSFLQEAFDLKGAFKKEIAFYRNIFPIYDSSQKEQGINNVADFHPKFYGARTSLGVGKTEVDEDAVIVLENLKSVGYSIVLRSDITVDIIKSVLKNLAKFHTIPLALKLKKPEVFEQLKVHLVPPVYPEKLLEQGVERILKVLEENEECAKLMDRVRRSFKKRFLKRVAEPWGTISHEDFWPNNILIKIEKRKKIIENKFVDFQNCKYNSPCKDILSYLFVHIPKEISEVHMDYLLDFYYDEFIGNLKQLKCTTDMFSRESFYEELKRYANETEYYHSIVRYAPVFGTISKDEISAANFKNLNFSSEYKEKSWFITLEYAKRGWI